MGFFLSLRVLDGFVGVLSDGGVFRAPLLISVSGMCIGNDGSLHPRGSMAGNFDLKSMLHAPMNLSIKPVASLRAVPLSAR